TRVEKDCKRKIAVRKIVPGRPARTGCKARANLCTLGTGQGAYDGCLPRLHFAKEPDYRWWQALTQTAQGSLERLSVNLRSKKLLQMINHMIMVPQEPQGRCILGVCSAISKRWVAGSATKRKGCISSVACPLCIV